MYCTQTDLIALMPEEKLIELTDDERLGYLSESASARITAAMEEAAAMIDAAARKGGYVTPLSDLTLARRLNKVLAICYLIKRREQMTEAREKDYDEAMKILDQLAKGELTLAGIASAGEAIRDDRDQVFSAENLETF